MHGRLAIAFAVGVMSLGIATAQPSEPQSLALTVAYADGRTTVTPLRPILRFWTPYFARAAETDPTVRAIDIDGTRDGNAALITVSVMVNGTAPADRKPVAQVRVTQDAPVDVSALGAWGIPSIRLALIPLDRPPAISVPAVSVASAQVEVHVTTISERPAYHITVTNNGHIPLRAIQFRAGGQTRQDSSGRKLDARDRPLVLPGGTFEFDLTLSARTPEQAALGVWSDWQQFLVTSVLWQDGLIEGDETLKRDQQFLDQQKRRLIPVVQQWLREAQGLPVAQAAVRLEELTRDDHRNQVSMEINNHLAAFRRSHVPNDGEAFHRWATETARAYSDWDARLEQLLAR